MAPAAPLHADAEARQATGPQPVGYLVGRDLQDDRHFAQRIEPVWLHAGRHKRHLDTFVPTLDEAQDLITLEASLVANLETAQLPVGNQTMYFARRALKIFRDIANSIDLRWCDLNHGGIIS